MAGSRALAGAAAAADRRAGVPSRLVVAAAADRIADVADDGCGNDMVRPVAASRPASGASVETGPGKTGTAAGARPGVAWRGGVSRWRLRRRGAGVATGARWRRRLQPRQYAGPPGRVSAGDRRLRRCAETRSGQCRRQGQPEGSRGLAEAEKQATVAGSEEA